MEKETFTKRLGENISKLRTEKKMTQENLAKACKKIKQSISRLEKGQINPTVYHLYEIAKALKVPVTRLLEF